MKKCLPTGVLLCLLAWSFMTQAVVYDHHEISTQLSDPGLHALSREYHHRYFTTKNPDAVVMALQQANLSPLQKEYILHELLLALAQQPPQPQFQSLVDQMKQYEVQAARQGDEGPLLVPVFHLNSQAAGIENAWTMYRTENLLHQLLQQDLSLAVDTIAAINAQDNQQRNPQWLGVKRSLQAISESHMKALTKHLQEVVEINVGHDPLISHVGLITANVPLIQKALASDNQRVRDWTLRQLPNHLNPTDSKSVLVQAAKTAPNDPMSTALLASHSHDLAVHELLIRRLHNPHTMEAAAFALSHTQDPKLINSLQSKYSQAQSKSVQNHILLALRLNPTDAAQLALDELVSQHEPDAQIKSWLQSLAGGVQ